jgi:diadenosine tetraphosphate (Ap4A) HIT family hydrolase
MPDRPSDCILCRGIWADPELNRVQVWENRLWRLTVSLEAEVLGFSYLEPKRHIPSIVELDGEEAAQFGGVVSRISSALKETTEADQIYIYIFGGGVEHLHVHLAPHRKGDALSSNMIRGKIREDVLPGGAVRMVSDEYPLLPEEKQREVARQVRRKLSKDSSGDWL